MLSKPVQGGLSGFIVALLILAAWQYKWLERWELTTWNWRVQYFARPSPATKRVKLILLDQASLDWGFQIQRWPWPWPREAYAALIRFTQRGGAKVFVFDVLLTEDSIHGVADDRMLSETIQAAGNIVSAMFLSAGQSGQATVWPSDAVASIPQTNALLPWLQAHLRPRMTRASFPVPEIVRYSAALGHVVGEPDQDAVIRRASLFSLFDGRPVPSLGMAAYLLGNPPQNAHMQGGWLRLDDSQIPIDQQGRAILNFRGPIKVYDVYGAKDILKAEIRLRGGEEPAINPAVFKDTYVVLGLSAPGLLDLRPTPLSPVASGAMIHATLIDNLLANDTLRDTPTPVVVLCLLLFSMCTAVVVTLGNRTWHTLLAFMFFFPLPVGVAFLAYAQGYWFPLVTPLLAVTLALATGLIINYATEGRQRAYIRHAFEHYLSPTVIQQLLDDPARLQAGGERRELSIMFTDLEGFSSISERMTPQDLTALLNDYLSDMTSIILDEGGTLDKYEGDAIIAFWNAPIDQPDHAVRACRAALRCQRKLAERRQALYAQTGAKLFMRIGLNSGEVVVGNMGSNKRFDYTIIGDNANLTARLEGANKVFGTYFMVSECTWLQAKHAFIGRELATLRVVGRRNPVTVYEILGLTGEARPDYLDQYEQALRLFKERHLQQAMALFQQLPDDPPSQSYVKRCRDAIASNAADWETVWNLTSK
ncbi:MAG: adenylate/guanylate cyclase domain-containing protein [Candidatus Tectomicrobia bacterium]